MVVWTELFQCSDERSLCRSFLCGQTHRASYYCCLPQGCSAN
jgi:hypothetical protein